MTPNELREQLFELVQESQGYGFISDADDHCGSFDELYRYVKDQEYHAQVTANKLRGFAARIKQAERGLQLP